MRLLRLLAVAALAATAAGDDATGGSPQVYWKQVGFLSEAICFWSLDQLTVSQIHICETTLGVKSYSGYVTLPQSQLTPFEQNLFWIFFEARNSPQTAPLTLWLQGGPGLPSTDQVSSKRKA